MNLLQDAGIAAGAVLNIEELFSDPQLSFRGHFWEPEGEPELDLFTFESPSFRLGELSARYQRPFPALGRDNAYVFLELLDISDAEFASLINEGVIN